MKQITSIGLDLAKQVFFISTVPTPSILQLSTESSVAWTCCGSST